jgi:hypothetical protein
VSYGAGCHRALKSGQWGGMKNSYFEGSVVRGWFSSTHLNLMKTAHGEQGQNGD